MHQACFVWTPTPPLSSRRTPRQGPARVCLCVLLAAGSGRPASRTRCGAPHLSFGRFVLLLCLAPSGLRLPLPVGLFALLWFIVFFLFSSCLRAPVVSRFLWFPAPGALALGACCLFPPHPPCLFFLLSFSVLVFIAASLDLCVFLTPSFSCAAPPLFFSPFASFLIFFVPFCFVLVFVAACFVWVLFPFALLFLLPPHPLSFSFFFPLRLPPPCVCSALCCLVSPRCAAILSGVLRCCVAVFCTAWRAVVSRSTCLWAAVACCVFCCVVPCCCLLLCVVPRLWSCRPAALPALWLAVLFRSALPCAVLCPWMLCCAVLVRVGPPGVVLLCAVLCCLALFGAAARGVVPSGAARCPGVLCVPALCVVLSPRAVCSALCLFWRGLLVRAVVRCCALSCVRPGVS